MTAKSLTLMEELSKPNHDIFHPIYLIHLPKFCKGKTKTKLKTVLRTNYKFSRAEIKEEGKKTVKEQWDISMRKESKNERKHRREVNKLYK